MSLSSKIPMTFLPRYLPSSVPLLLSRSHRFCAAHLPLVKSSAMSNFSAKPENSDQGLVPGMPLCRGVNIEDASIAQLQRYLTDKTFSARELAACCLERVEQLNSILRAVIEVNPDALDIADRLDRERASGRVRSPLHGIPFFVKDNIATKDKLQTTAGSFMLVGAEVAEDAAVVSFLRNAGAVLLGHTNMTQWASMRSSYYAEGYSPRGGQCRNPHNLAYHPGGSSGGCGVAVATNMCAFSLGTETDSSVIYPSDRNGVVGIKPTVGLTSRQGVIPEASSLDTVGVLGRTVGDAAVALDGISGIFETETTGTYESSVAGKDALKGARFGLPWKRIWEAASQDDITKQQYLTLRTVIQRIREAGAEIVEDVNIPSAEEIIPPPGVGWNWEYPTDSPEKSEFTVVKTEFYNDIKAYLGNLKTNPNNIRSLEDIVHYNTRNTDAEGGHAGTHPAYPKGQENFNRSLDSKGIKGDTYWKALGYIRRKSREEGIDAALRGSNGKQLDGLLVPVQAEKGVGCQLAAKAGYPMITIPVGVDSDNKGLPFGIGIIQTAWQDHQLIKYGSAIEDVIGGRPKPQFYNIHADNFMYVGS